MSEKRFEEGLIHSKNGILRFMRDAVWISYSSDVKDVHDSEREYKSQVQNTRQTVLVQWIYGKR